MWLTSYPKPAYCTSCVCLWNHRRQYVKIMVNINWHICWKKRRLVHRTWDSRKITRLLCFILHFCVQWQLACCDIFACGSYICNLLMLWVKEFS